MQDSQESQFHQESPNSPESPNSQESPNSPEPLDSPDAEFGQFTEVYSGHGQWSLSRAVTSWGSFAWPPFLVRRVFIWATLIRENQ